MTEQEIEEKYQDLVGFDRGGFSEVEFSEMKYYVHGYKQALEDFKKDLKNSKKYQALKKEIEEYYDEDNEDDLFDLSDIIEKHF